MTKEATDMLTNYYLRRRKMNECNQAQNTVRLLESLIRYLITILLICHILIVLFVF